MWYDRQKIHESNYRLLRTYIKFIAMKNKRLILILITIVFLLLIPFIAMQFTNEVDWTVSDFIVIGILLPGTGS